MLCRVHLAGQAKPEDARQAERGGHILGGLLRARTAEECAWGRVSSDSKAKVMSKRNE